MFAEAHTLQLEKVFAKLTRRSRVCNNPIFSFHYSFSCVCLFDGFIREFDGLFLVCLLREFDDFQALLLQHSARINDWHIAPPSAQANEFVRTMVQTVICDLLSTMFSNIDIYLKVFGCRFKEGHV